MRRELRNALAAKADVSDQFTSKIAELRRKLEAELGVEFLQDSDMNYGASQRLRLHVDSTGSAALPSSADVKWSIDYFLSSKAPLFAWIIFERKSERGNVWQFRNSEERPLLTLQAHISRISGVLEKLGWDFVSPTEWSSMAAGQITELDGVPATVFQCLFTELL